MVHMAITPIGHMLPMFQVASQDIDYVNANEKHIDDGNVDKGSMYNLRQLGSLTALAYTLRVP
jgi:hypothetical protein